MISKLRWVVGLLLPVAVWGAFYEVRVLEGLGGGFARPHAINGWGWVVGEAETKEGRLRAFRAGPEGTMMDLGTLGGEISRAFDVNDAGVIVGEAMREDGQMAGFVWREGEGMKELEAPEGTLGSRAVAINGKGVILGMVEDVEGMGPVVWEEGRMRRLSRLPVAGAVQAFDLNDGGDVVGQVETGPQEFFMSHGFFHGEALTTPHLQSFRLITQEGSGAALAVNLRGVAVGFAGNGDGVSRAFRYDPGGGMTILDTLNGMYSAALGVNEAGWSVGEYILSFAEDEHGFVHDGERMHDLNDVAGGAAGIHVLRGVGINDKGWIAGQGLLWDRVVGVVLAPVDVAGLTGRPVFELEARDGGEGSVQVVVRVPEGVEVNRVSLVADREVIATSWEPPFEWNFMPREGGGKDLHALVYDGEGNRHRTARVDAGKVAGSTK